MIVLSHHPAPLLYSGSEASKALYRRRDPPHLPSVAAVARLEEKDAQKSPRSQGEEAKKSAMLSQRSRQLATKKGPKSRWLPR